MDIVSKEQIRKEIAIEKNRYSRSVLEKKSKEIFRQIEYLTEFQKAKTIVLYHSLEDEVNTHDFIEKWYQKKSILLPVVTGESLKLYLYEGFHKMKEGVYGIKEPTGTPYTKYTDIDLAIIPGVCFDRNCNRLGRGKGYYDRLLPTLICPRIGVCFSFQITDRLPSEPHDINMHHVITETAMISFQSERM